jgi:hypothetical protein
MIELGENGDLDGAGRGKNLVSVKEILSPVRKVQNGHAKHTVEVAVNLIDSRFQFLPKNLFFLRRGLLGTGRNWMACGGENANAGKSFEHEDLRVGRIIKPVARERGKSCNLVRSFVFLKIGVPTGHGLFRATGRRRGAWWTIRQALSRLGKH